jgi:hypothetical protein
MHDLRVIGCTIAAGDLPAQQSRAEQLLGSALRSRREDDRVEVWFSPDLDERVVRDFIATESGCCSFFSMDWDDGERRLAIAAPPEHRPALDTIAAALGA